MTFRSQLALDVASTFLDLEEFGEEIVIEGVALVAVLDDDLTIQRTRGAPETEGVHARRRVLHLTAGLITTPAEGARLTVDGVHWYVERVAEDEGVLQLTLARQVA